MECPSVNAFSNRCPFPGMSTRRLLQKPSSKRCTREHDLKCRSKGASDAREASS